MVQTALFDDEPKKEEIDLRSMPLAGRMRPRCLDEFVGQEKLVGPGRVLRNMIEQDRVTSMIFWGPPGVGKTTLAGIIANSTDAEFVQYSAVTGGIKEVKDIMTAAEMRRRHGKRTVLFVDEIHRFNKAQQDAFLPFVEKGSITLIGATTENPSFEVNSALLSRCRVFVLEGLGKEDIVKLLRRAVEDPRGFPDMNIVVSDEVLGLIAGYANGDARTAMNVLEAAVSVTPEAEGQVRIGKHTVVEVTARKSLLYDKDGEMHYDLISALHKSMRNSDPDAAIYWLARMLAGGEDPLFIARRLIEFAGDDVGLADPNAHVMAVTCFDACRDLGMPECRYALAETVVYLSLAPRSNSIAVAISQAMDDAEKMLAEPVPLRIRNASTKLMEDLGYGKGYEYAEGTDEKIAKMQCLPDSLKDRRYYEPGDRGNEVYYRKRIDAIREWREGKRDEPPR
ncbi:Recombination protein MgsA [Thermoplasmatales archaeon BRNA1]|nr:Recombination protein MgsA [Thermoplasmatales archaeon BRNA1]